MEQERDIVPPLSTEDGPQVPPDVVGEQTDGPPVEVSTKPTEEGLASDGKGIAGDDEAPPSSKQPDTMPVRSAPDSTKVKTPNGKHLMRTISAPSSLETADNPMLLSQESVDDLKVRLQPATEGRSMTHVPYDRESPARATNSTITSTQTAPAVSENIHEHVANEGFAEFIKSPRGQNAIVEQSPGGRYVRFVEKLGSGASKDVYRAYDTTEGIEVAWNVVQLSGVPKAERNRIVNEVRLLERLHHPNIISFHGSWVNRERQEVNFVTEILSSGTLTSFIEKVQVIRWKIAKRWAFQILKGLEYLHSQDPPVIHRDLKCENIFINGTSGDLRIGDLGLSTVHRNGKVLSVLGTPEFMAPDLYEESAYDEKVDIYAFGMCLLEILTQEVPYRECNNPAQIYRKVMSGIKPGSLGRLRSKMARDFINLCLGYRDETTGNYIRPSAIDLLQHEFLAKSADDEETVIVDRPLNERTISEAPTTRGDNGLETLGSDSDGASMEERVRMPNRRRVEFEDDSDQFDAMPDSEVNIRKVKVFTGRNEELKDDSDDVHSAPPALTDTRTTVTSAQQQSTWSVPRVDAVQQQGQSQHQEVQPPGPQHQHLQMSHQQQSTPQQGQHIQQQGGIQSHQMPQHANHQQQGQTQPPPPSQMINPQDQASNFLFDAAVIEDQSAPMSHYEDDILKLIITLPVDGQTQNVQFKFHLVEDDPVEVAREMITELGIPQEATLEISGTISALARNARMEQGKYRRQEQIQGSTVQGNGSPVGPGPIEVPPPPPLPQAVVQSSQPIAAESNQTVSAQNSAQSSAQPSVQNSVQPQVSALPPMPPVGQTGANLNAQSALLSSVPVELVHIGPQTNPSPFQTPNQTPAVSPYPNNIPRKVGMSLTSAISDISMMEINESALENQALGALRGDIDEDDAEEDDSLTEELKRLDEDFQKNILRAQKVFDSRMDNLKRSKLEKEMQHKKTLQKHERERIEFEKRVEQEAKEQTLRLEKMQREWESQREMLAKQPKKKHYNVDQEGAQTQQQASTTQFEALRSLTSSPSLENVAHAQLVSSSPANAHNVDYRHQRSNSYAADALDGTGGR